MVQTIKSLSLGFLLIFLAALSLLISDWSRRTGDRQHIPRVAILQHASTPVLDDAVHGMIDGLAKKGFVEGKTITYQRYNSEGDISVSNSIAKEIVAGNFDMALTSSTISMQTLANANRGQKMVQFFGAVADPAAAGIGIDMSKPSKISRQRSFGRGTTQDGRSADGCAARTGSRDSARTNYSTARSPAASGQCAAARKH